jgi:hypothetical protein
VHDILIILILKLVIDAPGKEGEQICACACNLGSPFAAACDKITSPRAAGSNGDDKTPVYEQLLLLSRLN